MFAVICLQGATPREDKEDNTIPYGKPMKNIEIVEQCQAPTPEAAALLELLKKYSPKG